MNDYDNDNDNEDIVMIVVVVCVELLMLVQFKLIVEVVLFVFSYLLMVVQLVELFGEEYEVMCELIVCMFEVLVEDCVGCGVELQEVVFGFCYQVKQDVYFWLLCMWIECFSCYLCVLLEMLVLIVYCQLIIWLEIEQICGVVVFFNIIKMMEECDWICVVGYCDVLGWFVLFGIICVFFDYFNLKLLDELLLLLEICDMEDLQLCFEFELLLVCVIKDLLIDLEVDVVEVEVVEQVVLIVEQIELVGDV